MFLFLHDRPLGIGYTVTQKISGILQSALKKSRGPGGAHTVEKTLLRQLALQNQWNWKAGYGGEPASPPVRIGWALNGMRDLAHGIELKRHKKIDVLWAGPNLVVLPLEAPDLMNAPEIDRMLVPCDWVADLYRAQLPALAPKLTVWPVGLDTDYWQAPTPRPTDYVLIYDKKQLDLSGQIRKTLEQRGIPTRTVRYGAYSPAAYREMLSGAQAMVWVSRSETQALAVLEALSMNVPVLAWDPGEFQYRSPILNRTFTHPATSVPYFDARCGKTFSAMDSFSQTWERFEKEMPMYQPRAFLFEQQLDLRSNLARLPLKPLS